MTLDEQEALSHRYYCGFWCVPLENGRFGAFLHPDNSEELYILEDVAAIHEFAAKLRTRGEARKRAVKTQQLDLEGIEI